MNVTERLQDRDDLTSYFAEIVIENNGSFKKTTNDVLVRILSLRILSLKLDQQNLKRIDDCTFEDYDVTVQIAIEDDLARRVDESVVPIYNPIGYIRVDRGIPPESILGTDPPMSYPMSYIAVTYEEKKQ